MCPVSPLSSPSRPVHGSPGALPPPRRHDVEADDPPPIPISDQRVPQHIREYGLTFNPPASAVIDSGDGEYTLLSSDGEVLDVVWHEAPRTPGPVTVAVVGWLLRLPASPLYGIAFALLLTAPTVALLARAWTTQSLQLLLAGLLAGLVTALTVLLWRGLRAMK
jgi:hypothetical protein